MGGKAFKACAAPRRQRPKLLLWTRREAFMMRHMASTFTGFPKGGVEFFQALTMNMEREWFAQHKGDYVRLWQAPMEAYLLAVQAGLKKAFPKGAKYPPKVMRIYRDVRFSKDKTPYKTSQSGMLPLFGEGNPMGSTGFYSEFGPSPFVAMGRWMMEPEALLRFRRAVVSEKSGPAFARAVAKALSAGYEVSSAGVLKRVPKGFEADHPRAPLLKLKGFALSFPAVPQKLLQSPKLVDWVVERALAVKGIIQWVDAATRGASLPKL
jgi:uncharacterized protein (TIGR02453 family)